MKIALALLAALSLAGCCSEPVLQLQSPVSLGLRPAAVPGPQYVMQPQYAAPTYTPVAGAAGCAPAFMAPPVASPCK